MRRFVLNRTQDVSGVSGTGIVAEGIEFTDGQVAIRWLTSTASTTIWDSAENAIAVHGHGGLTELKWLDNA